MQPSVAGFISCNLHTNSHSATILTLDTMRTTLKYPGNTPPKPPLYPRPQGPLSAEHSRDVSILNVGSTIFNYRARTPQFYHYIYMATSLAKAPDKNVQYFEVSYDVRCNQLIRRRHLNFQRYDDYLARMRTANKDS